MTTSEWLLQLDSRHAALLKAGTGMESTIFQLLVSFAQNLE